MFDALNTGKVVNNQLIDKLNSTFAMFVNNNFNDITKLSEEKEMPSIVFGNDIFISFANHTKFYSITLCIHADNIWLWTFLKMKTGHFSWTTSCCFTIDMISSWIFSLPKKIIKMQGKKWKANEFLCFKLETGGRIVCWWGKEKFKNYF